MYGIIFPRHHDLWGLVLAAQLCPTLSDPMDRTPPGSSVHGIFQVRILEWVAIPISRGSSQPRDRTWVSHIAGRFLTIWATMEAWSWESLLKYVLSWSIDICPIHGRRYLTDSLVSRQVLQGWTRAFQDQVAYLDVRDSSWAQAEWREPSLVTGPLCSTSAGGTAHQRHVLEWGVQENKPLQHCSDDMYHP